MKTLLISISNYRYIPWFIVRRMGTQQQLIWVSQILEYGRKHHLYLFNVGLRLSCTYASIDYSQTILFTETLRCMSKVHKISIDIAPFLRNGLVQIQKLEQSMFKLLRVKGVVNRIREPLFWIMEWSQFKDVIVNDSYKKANT